MSGVLTEIGSLLFTANRSLAGVIPDIAVREEGFDELEITSHPIETGAAITDHAFQRQPVLKLEYSWSNSSLSALSVQSVLSGQIPDLSFGSQRVRQIYEQLLAIQASREPFQVVTGKRLYSNMLMESLGIMTDVSTENALVVTATCRGIIIVSTSSTTIAPQAQQAMPASTAGVTDAGQVQPAAVPNQSAYSLFGGG
jgi:hypothetical protein